MKSASATDTPTLVIPRPESVRTVNTERLAATVNLAFAVVMPPTDHRSTVNPAPRRCATSVINAERSVAEIISARASRMWRGHCAKTVAVEPSILTSTTRWDAPSATALAYRHNVSRDTSTARKFR